MKKLHKENSLPIFESNSKFTTKTQPKAVPTNTDDNTVSIKNLLINIM